MNWVTEKLLPAIPSAGAVGVKDLAERTGVCRHEVARRCGMLASRGLIVRVDMGRYRLTAAGAIVLKAGGKVRSGPRGPHTGPRRAPDSLRKRLWSALRMAKKATIPELLTIAARCGEENSTNNAARYLRHLAAAGYVAVLRDRAAGTAVTSNGFKRYFLLPDKDTGPLPPRYRAAKHAVYDPNLGIDVPLKDGAAP